MIERFRETMLKFHGKYVIFIKKLHYRILIVLRGKCPYSEFFWSVFSRIWTEYGNLQSKCTYSVRITGKSDQKNSEYGHFSRSVGFQIPLSCLQVSLLTLNEFSKLISFYFL